MTIDEAELEDFRAVVNKFGLAAEEFEVWETREPPPPDEATGVFLERATVTVRYKKNGIARSYDAGGHGTNWPDAFEQDLRGGAFGPITKLT